MKERLAGRRILIVEDEVILAWALQDMLAGYGCVVVGPAAGVADALDLIGREAIDAAVLDVNLNREKAYPVADALVRGAIPFVFSTAYSAESIEEGYRHHPSVQKPHSAPELADALSLLLPPPPALEFPTEAARSAAGIGLWAFDAARDSLELDPVAQALLGLPAGPMGASGHCWPMCRPRIMPRCARASPRWARPAPRRTFRFAGWPPKARAPSCCAAPRRTRAGACWVRFSRRRPAEARSKNFCAAPPFVFTCGRSIRGLPPGSSVRQTRCTSDVPGGYFSEFQVENRARGRFMERPGRLTRRRP